MSSSFLESWTALPSEAAEHSRERSLCDQREITRFACAVIVEHGGSWSSRAGGGRPASDMVAAHRLVQGQTR